MSQTKQNIILIGMMGTGKSTVGGILAEHLGYTLVDLDAAVVSEAGMTIPEIFELHGEAFFRKVETDMLCKVLSSGNRQIVATGGGAVLKPINCELMVDGGFVVALTAEAEMIIDRVKGDSNRPLLAGNAEERIRTILEERKQAYQFAHCTVDTSRLGADEVAQQILTHYRV
ncbi:shikimate kinase [Paenibacillus sp. KQZ6P-2]|uniref:Shikimate kinase n=1 Tax=Paenibacillus mangrovi TaxID=2931978 RepID=A0A9X2B1W3_9BACL|nr:shikimate kinase [Paenibacillus mangrovi]MCJ8011310.1 shikimate kinase [Paenibacillus mangrovi]